MVNSKKLLSLFLAVVMVLSVFTVMASAYTRVETEGTADIDIKYTVQKVSELPETDAGSAALAGDNFYAVTVWMKSARAVDILTVPFHYNKTLFSPITLSDGEVTYPYGAGMDQDTYYTDMGEGALYLYTLGDYMNNTGMYKANGTTATTKALAKCIGLGNSNAAAVGVTTELVSPDHTLYGKWGAGLPENTGVVFAQVKASTAVKNAYLNTIEGITTYTDWVNMFTIYFEAIAEDVTGAEFGVYTDDCFKVDGNYDASGYAYYASTASYSAQVPSFNVVSNAVVAEAGPEFPATSIVNPLKGQIRFHSDDAGEYAGSYDVRALAKITSDDFTATFTDEATAKEMIKEIGFVFAAGSNVAAPSAAAVMGLVENGTAAEGYTKKTVEFIARNHDFNGDVADYAFSCVVTGMTDDDYDNSLIAVGYIAYEVEGVMTYAYYPAAQTVSFAELFDAHYDSAFPEA